MDAGQLSYVKFGRSRRIPRRALVTSAADNLHVRTESVVGFCLSGWRVPAWLPCDTDGTIQTRPDGPVVLNIKEVKMNGNKQHQKPRTARTISRYEDLDRYVRAFVDGSLGLLVIVGGAGLQKSETVRHAAGPGVCILDGKVTAFELYRELWRHRNAAIVIDDVDELYADRQAVRLLKGLCQTNPVKTVSWHSAARALDGEGIPREFQTTSRVLIIANSWRTLNADVEALEDRGHVVFFEPSPPEVHIRVATWFWDQEIFDFVAENLDRIQSPSMRDYQLAWESKVSGLPWRAMLVNRWLADMPAWRRLVAELKADPSFATEKARAEAFQERCGGSRATYFNQAKKLRRTKRRRRVPAPSIVLQNASPGADAGAPRRRNLARSVQVTAYHCD